MSTITIEGTVENIGRTIIGAQGVEVRTDAGDLVSVPVASKDAIKILASLLFKRVRITIDEVQVQS